MRVINKIEYISQRDARWSTTLIGDSQTSLGRKGCTITCLAMLTDYFKCKMTPAEIAKKDWFAYDSLQWINIDLPTFSFRWREGAYFSDKPVDMEVIYAYLSKGDNSKEANERAVLLEVANHSHWVVGLWKTVDNDILAIDPWTGKTCEVLKTYGNITGAALFIGNTKDAWRGKGKPVAPDFN